jgi:putative oxidoreductase
MSGAATGLSGQCRRLACIVRGGARSVDRPAPRPIRLFLLRVAIGADWVVHALLKTYRGMETHAVLLAKNGISPLLAWPTFGFELVGGITIILGIYSRYWSACLLVVVWVKWPVGWLYSNPGGGWEYPMFWFFAQLALVPLGDGAFAPRRTAPPATIIG